MIFDDPDFSLLESREFFLSRQSECREELEDVQLQTVPSTIEAKRLQQEQRFKVKQINEGISIVKKQDAAQAREMMDRFHGLDETIPAVELHMFPADPLDLGSKWQVLLVPKAQKIFGQTLYLCRPPLPSRQSKLQQPCVAKATFSPLPPRFCNVWGGWDPALDPLRSVPHRVLLMLEVLVLASIIFLSCKAGLLLLQMLLLAMSERREDNHNQLLARLLAAPLPASYKLAMHASVYNKAGSSSELVLDAGQDVAVVEIKCMAGGIARYLPERLAHYASVLPGVSRVVWGRLLDPEGWIVLYDTRKDRPAVLGVASDLAPYRANSQVMIPLSVLARRLLILAASHASALWVLLEQYASIVPVSILCVIAGSVSCVHVLVVFEVCSTAKWGLCCDQVLEQHRQRLRPAKSLAREKFAVIVVIMLFAAMLGLLPSVSAKLQKISSAFLRVHRVQDGEAANL